MCYINYYFENISYDENYYLGTFLCPDAKVRCDFIYNRITKEIEITNNNMPIKKILPIPIFWLDKKLRENGMLKSKECKISF